MTEVADRLIQHGLQNLETVFEWQPGMGKRCVAEAVAHIAIPFPPAVAQIASS